MRFSLGLVAGLAASVHALPRAADSAFRPFEEGIAIKKNDTEVTEPDDEPDATDTCRATGKTVESWNEYEIGDYLIVRANAEDDYTGDIQEMILKWGRIEDIYHFHCEPMRFCEANFNKKDCESDYLKATYYFVGFAIANLNNYLTSLSEAVDRTAGIADGMAATVVDDFANNPEKLTLPIGPAILTAALLGMVGTFITGGAAVGVGVAGGLTNLAVGSLVSINEAQSGELEPKFNDFAEVTKWLAKASETLQNLVGDYARYLLTEIPTQDRDNGVYYVDNPAGVPYILQDGAFAEPIKVDQIPDDLYVGLFSGPISILWKEELAWVVKYRAGQKMDGTPLCDIEGLFPDHSHCDEDGNFYLLLRYPKDAILDDPWNDHVKDEFKNLKGIDKLGDYKMDVGIVAKGTEASFNRNGGEAYMEWDKDSAIDFLLDNDRANIGSFTAFNFPFCDNTGTVWNSDEIKDIPHVIDEACDPECQILVDLQSCHHAPGMPWRHPETFGYKKVQCLFFAEECEVCIPNRPCTTISRRSLEEDPSLLEYVK